jgi:hypothetical protein
VSASAIGADCVSLLFEQSNCGASCVICLVEPIGELKHLSEIEKGSSLLQE